MLSLAKLAAFAAADSDVTLQLETINAELNIVDYQEQLSDHLLQAFGYEVENQKVLRIEEIINVSIKYFKRLDLKSSLYLTIILLTIFNFKLYFFIFNSFLLPMNMIQPPSLIFAKPWNYSIISKIHLRRGIKSGVQQYCGTIGHNMTRTPLLIIYRI